MDIDEIKRLIEAMTASDLAVMEVERGGWTLRLQRGGEAASALRPATSVSDVAPPAPSRPRASSATASRIDPEVRSPLSGVVHLRPAPDAAPFVEPGRPIAAGDVLCLVEAMKMFNEVRAERAGTVEAILVASGGEVDAGQPLLRIA